MCTSVRTDFGGGEVRAEVSGRGLGRGLGIFLWEWFGKMLVGEAKGEVSGRGLTKSCGRICERLV